MNPTLHPLFKDIFTITPATFEKVTLSVFKYQYQNVPIYKRYCDLLNKTPDDIKEVKEEITHGVEFGIFSLELKEDFSDFW